MKVFYSDENDYPRKINFVDENNVVLGYNVEAICCENAGWFISDTMLNEVPEKLYYKDRLDIQDYDEANKELDGFVFDPSFIKEINLGYDKGNIAIFMVVKNEHKKYLHLFNLQNGYYSHDFDFSPPLKEFKREGSL